MYYAVSYLFIKVEYCQGGAVSIMPVITRQGAGEAMNILWGLVKRFPPLLSYKYLWSIRTFLGSFLCMFLCVLCYLVCGSLGYLLVWACRVVCGRGAHSRSFPPGGAV